jgi:hypothetical protein
MSLFGQTLILYLVIGVGVAIAVYVSDRGAESRNGFLVTSAIPFWPLYLPLLLTPIGRDTRVAPRSTSEPADEFATAIAQVDAELDAALGSLDGWAEDVLAREKLRIGDLRSAWSTQAQRIREMDKVLALHFGDEPVPDSGADERVRSSWQARRQNVARLRRLRRRAADDLAGSLASVRELVSMIHLAKFSGAPAARAEELVAQIAAAVEGLSEMSESEDVECEDV